MADIKTIPAWMREPAGGLDPAADGAETRRESVMARTLQGLGRLVRESVFSEKIAARPGLLQGIDPRVKVAGIIVLLIATSLLVNWYLVLGLYLVTVALASASLISPRFFIQRVWMFIPLFAAIIALPSIFNVVREGDPLWVIWDFGREVELGPWSLGTYLAITYQGVKGAVMLVLRVATSVSLGVLLALTTRWSELLKALRVFFVPRIFVLILSMTYRYVFLLLAMAADIFTARTSRMVGPSTPREDRRFLAAGMGTMLGKSHAFSEEVYAAMVSRGFDGEPVPAAPLRTNPADWLWLASVMLLVVSLIGGDRIIGW